MSGPQNERRPAQPGQGGGPSADLIFERLDDNTHNAAARVTQVSLRQRPMGPGELVACRAIWWHLAAGGVRLPAERGVIVVDGGRP